MPCGLAPNVDDLLPSGRTNSMETRDQAPKSCSFIDFCWLTALPASKDIANAEVAYMPMILRRFIGFLPELRRTLVRDQASPFLLVFVGGSTVRPSAVGKVITDHSTWKGRPLRMSLVGLGRVITRRRGYRRAATGGMRCKVTVSSIFFRFRSGRQPGSSSGQPDRLSGCAEPAVGPSQAAIAASSGLMPTIFSTRVML